MSVEEQVKLEAQQRKETREAKKRLKEEQVSKLDCDKTQLMVLCGTSLCHLNHTNCIKFKQEAAKRKMEEDKAAAEEAAAKAAEEKAAAVRTPPQSV